MGSFRILFVPPKDRGNPQQTGQLHPCDEWNNSYPKTMKGIESFDGVALYWRALTSFITQGVTVPNTFLGICSHKVIVSRLLYKVFTIDCTDYNNISI